MRVLGLISGTSVDAIDVAVGEFGVGDDPAVIEMVTRGHLEVPWEGGLRESILSALPPAQVGVGDFCDLDTAVGQQFGMAAAKGLAEFGPVDLIASHGQTLFHRVVGGRALGTLQIGQPAWIHAATGVPVINDFRSADIAAGGHGAPLVSVLDQLWLGDQPTAVLNIGGIGNITIVGGDEVSTGDTGPGCCLLDAAAGQIGLRHDVDGQRAAAGNVDARALDALLKDEYYSEPFPRSTGREYFHSDYVAQHLGRAGVPVPQGDDLFATLTELSARTIIDGIRDAGGADRLVISGGGARNPVLTRRLAELGMPPVTTSELGMDADAKEAYLFALLGYLSINSLPGTASRRTSEPHGERVTGAKTPAVLGSLTPPAPTLKPVHPKPAHGIRRLVVRPR